MATSPLCEIRDLLQELIDCSCVDEVGCPAPTIELFCDDSDTKYIILDQLSACGPSGTYLATPYYQSGTLTAYTPTSTAPQICSDASIKDQQCLVDECGDKWTCVTVLTPVDGSVIETQTCTPYIDPCPVVEEVGERAAVLAKAELQKTAIKSSVREVKSIKLSVTAVNTQLEEVADADTGALPAPVGATCPCACPEDPNTALLEQLIECICGPCDETPCTVQSSGSSTGLNATNGISIFSVGGVAGTGIKLEGIDAALAAAINDAIANGHELVITFPGVGVFSATNIVGAGPYSAGDTASIRGDAPVCGTAGVDGEGPWTTATFEVLS